MIPFNNYGHSKKTSGVDILYWVDASDSGSYSVDGANNVTQLINKGSAGGVFNVVGSPKYLNGGFESHSVSDYFERDMGLNFLSSNSFTIAVTFDVDNLTGGASSINNLFEVNSDATNDNMVGTFFTNNGVIDMWHKGSGVGIDFNQPLTIGKKTLIFSYDFATKVISKLHYNSVYNQATATFIGVQNDFIRLLESIVTGWGNSGANNPLHEFRLYDYPMSQTEMTTLQDELKTKWGKLLYHVDASNTNSFTTDGSNNVLSLNNLGTEGGSFTINGSPKYLNGGFDNNSVNDYFERDLGEPFLTTNSFTMAVVVDFRTGFSTGYDFFATIYGDGNNRLGAYRNGLNFGSYLVGSPTVDNIKALSILGRYTFLLSVSGGVVKTLNYDGTYLETSGVTNNNTNNAKISLLRSLNNTLNTTGDPLHEFRLYDYAMSQQQMTDLQTQLNNKWI